jgi:flagellar protein FliS
MFANSRNAARAYASVGVHTGAMAASPHQLISMLFEGAMIAILKARQHMAAANVLQKGIAINHAVSIIDSGLRGALNLREGGEIARNLDALYSYMTLRLTAAHRENDPAKLQEVYKLLADLKSTWEAIAPHCPAAPAAMES